MAGNVEKTMHIPKKIFACAVDCYQDKKLGTAMAVRSDKP